MSYYNRKFSNKVGVFNQIFSNSKFYNIVLFILEICLFRFRWLLSRSVVKDFEWKENNR